MTIDKFQTWLMFFQTLEGPKDINGLITAILISAVIIFAHIAIKGIKYNAIDIVTYFIITTILNLFASLLFGNYFLMIIMGSLSPIISKFFINKFRIFELIDKKFIGKEDISTENEEDVKKEEKPSLMLMRFPIFEELPENSSYDENDEQVYMKKHFELIGELFSNFDYRKMTDILFMYGYISYKQKINLIGNTLFEAEMTDLEVLDNLKNTPILSEDDTRMAIGLSNYIRSKNRFPAIKTIVELMLQDNQLKKSVASNTNKRRSKVKSNDAVNKRF